MSITKKFQSSRSRKVPAFPGSCECRGRREARRDRFGESLE
jgi:hypothetical protein